MEKVAGYYGEQHSGVPLFVIDLVIPRGASRQSLLFFHTKVVSMHMLGVMACRIPFQSFGALDLIADSMTHLAMLAQACHVH